MTEPTLRLFLSGGLIAFFIALEAIFPARHNELGLKRIGRHLTLALLNGVVPRLALVTGLSGFALWAQSQGLGLFNLVALPAWLEAIVAFALLDLAIWAQHLTMHHIPLLWRLHRVHHSDIHMDVTTAYRFHPAEILFSLGFKIMIIVALGVPPLVVVFFEIALNAGAMFTHANLRVPSWLESGLRRIFVTPAMHLIHHSPIKAETNSNYGFSFVIWDRLFGTYRSRPVEVEQEIGLEDWRQDKDQSITALLVNPFT